MRFTFKCVHQEDMVLRPRDLELSPLLGLLPDLVFVLGELKKSRQYHMTELDVQVVAEDEEYKKRQEAWCL
jgi:hypothetical protein